MILAFGNNLVLSNFQCLNHYVNNNMFLYNILE